MSSPLDVRYETLSVLSEHGERRVEHARDRLTGETVVLKTDHRASALQELRTLLALPPGVGPAVRDVVWTGGEDGRLIIAIEHLTGRTLAEAAPDLLPAQLPGIVHAICQCLGHLHRADFVHADIKPANIFLLDSDAECEVRLLDFGFTLSRMADPWTNQETGGTPAFMAPELMRGWVVDGRADQYSLGRTLRELFPELEEDDEWAELLETMCERRPARRFPDILSLRDAIGEALGADAVAPEFPRFGAGPLRGREGSIREVSRAVEKASKGGVVVQARPGTGLSRFLHEVVGSIAERRGSGCRTAELPAGALTTEGPAIAVLEELTRDTRVVVWGVSDPSPGLRGLDPNAAACVRGLPQVFVPALRPSAYREIVADSLGAGGTSAEALASFLHMRSDGDLGVAAEGFAWALESMGEESGLSWTLDAATLAQTMREWRGAPSGPEWASLPEEHRAYLIVCAQAGRSVPRRVATGLMDCFAPSGALEQLIDHGYLLPAEDDALVFVTSALHEEALAASFGDREDIDRWLNEHTDPDLRLPSEVIEACKRARRVGDRSREATLLSEALEKAYALRLRDQIRQLVAYPGKEPALWTEDEVEVRADNLAPILGTAWSRDRILHAVAVGLSLVDRELSARLYERIAHGDDGAAAVQAKISILNRVCDRPGMAETFERLVADLEQRSRDHGDPLPGVLGFYRARYAIASGSPHEAEQLARRAAQQLQGKGVSEEAYSLQTLAFLRFSRDASGAITRMRSALDVAVSPEQDALMCRNLAIMHAQVGDFQAAADTVEAGISRLDGLITEQKLIGLQSRLVWAWADLDLIEQARKAALSLLSLGAVRSNPNDFIGIKMLLGYCHLHRSSSRVAISETAAAWQACGEGLMAKLRGGCLRAIVDVLLDLEAWDVVREYGEALDLETIQDPGDQISQTRARALRAQAEGEPDEAALCLDHDLKVARAVHERQAVARYVHHLGVVRREQAELHSDSGRAEQAVSCFEEALGMLGEKAFGYHRARSSLGLARSLIKLRKTADAAVVLDRAIEIAKRIKSLGLLAECLQERAQLGLCSDSS